MEKEVFTEAFHVHYVHLEPDRQIGLNSHPTWELSYIVIGSGRRFIGNEVNDFRSGEVVLIPPGMEHCWEFSHKMLDDSGRICNITVEWSHDFMKHIALSIPQINLNADSFAQIDTAVKICGKDASLIRTLLQQMVKEPDYLQVPSFIRLLLIIANGKNTLIAGQCDKVKTAIRNKRKEIETFVSCNLSRSITLDEAAAHVGMNRSSFCTFFKREFHQSFFTYLNAARIKMAYFLLRSNADKTISQICYECGFTNISYFDRVFRKRTGQSPRSYKSTII